MKILNVISDALRAKRAPDSAKLAELLAQTEAETASARHRLVDLEARRSDMALASESERLAYRADLTSTRDDIADGEAAIEALRTRHDTAVEAEAEDGRKKAHKSAKTEADKLPGLIDEYAKAAQAVHDVVAKIAEIDAIVRAANEDLPADTARIAGSVELRSIPFLPRKVVNEKVVDLWVREGRREPASELVQAKVRQEGNGRGYHHPEHSPVMEYYVKQWFTRREYREAETAMHAVGLDKIVLPDARVAKPKADRPVVIELVPLKAAA